MATMRRNHVNKRSSAKHFAKGVHKTHPYNQRKIMRGGYRL